MTSRSDGGVRQIGSVAVANALTAAAQVAVLTALARTGSTSEVADFAPRHRRRRPLYLVLTIGLRLITSGEAVEAEPFSTFLWARACSPVVVAGAVAVALHLLISGDLTGLVVAVVPWQGVDGWPAVITPPGTSVTGRRQLGGDGAVGPGARRHRWCGRPAPGRSVVGLDPEARRRCCSSSCPTCPASGVRARAGRVP